MTTSGAAHNFDHVILACHGDQALRLLVNPTADEKRLLQEFKYQPNVATLHTDASVMPRTRLAWSSWNYEITRDDAGSISTATHYWMNSLQGVSDRENYFVTINRPESIAPEKVLRRINYEHPLFSLGAMQAQAEFPALNAAARGTTETYFAGAWQRFGFHEDGLLSAARLSEQLLGRDPWVAHQASCYGRWRRDALVAFWRRPGGRRSTAGTTSPTSRSQAKNSRVQAAGLLVREGIANVLPSHAVVPL